MTPIERLGDAFARAGEKVLPQPLTIALALSVLAIGIALVTPKTAALIDQSAGPRLLSIAELWLGGVWDLGFLAFALQMCVVLLTGFGLARAPIVLRFLRRVAALPQTNRGAVCLTALASCVGCWINWGLGLIFAGLLSAEIRERFRRERLPYQRGLLVAAAYTGLMVWHGGLSGSAPLKVAESGAPLAAVGSAAAIPVGLAQTTFSRGNLVLSVMLFVVVGAILRLMAGKGQVEALSLAASSRHSTDDDPADGAAGASPARSRTLAEWLDESRPVPIAICALAVVALAARIRARGAFAVDLNFVNTVFLCAGLLLHGNLRSYLSAVTEGGRAVVGIVLQFPFYGGILGIMKGAGLAEAIARGFVSASGWLDAHWGIGPDYTFPAGAFFSAGLLNIFIPSGGGQWMVQGPILVQAAVDLQLPLGQTVMAFSYGDEWTNMVQPFWAVPLVGLTDVNVKEFLGYCCLLMLLTWPLVLICLWWL